MIDKKLRGQDLIGRKCRVTRQIHNGAGQGVSPETICTITRVVPGLGFVIRTDKCPHCGQYAWISHVSRDELELVKEVQPNE